MSNIIPMYKNGLTPKEKIINAQDYLWSEHPIGIPFLSKWKIVEDSGIETACTNGKYLRYSPEWIDKLSSQIVKGIMLHEVAHVLFAHHVRRGDRDPRLWNVAADLAINSHLEPWYNNLGILSDLKGDGVAAGIFPLEGNYLSMPPGKSAEWYYTKLVEEINSEEEDDQCTDGDGDGEAVGDSSQPGRQSLGNADVNESTEQGTGEGEVDTNSQPTSGGSPSKSQAEEDKFQERVKKYLGDDYNKPSLGGVEDAPTSEQQDSAEVEEEWKDMVADAVVLQKQQGKGLGEGLSMMDHVNKRANNGWALLRQWISKKALGGYTWKRPSRRHGHRRGVMLPDNKTKNKTTGVVIVDTSGSMGDSECAEAINQIDKIIREYRNATVTLVQCDTRVIEAGTRTFTNASFPLKIPNEWYGRGGTNMIPSIRWVQQRASEYDWCLIVSDMYWEVMWQDHAVPHTGVPTVYVGINTDPEADIKPDHPQTHYISVEVAA